MLVKQLNEYYNADKLKEIFASYRNPTDQLYVSSIDGKTYHIPNGNFWQQDYEENLFTTINNYFKDTYVEEVYNDVDNKYGVCRARFLTLTELKRAYSYHIDRTPRLHIPVITNHDCYFMINEELYKMPSEGQLYFADTTNRHSALNLGEGDRTHLVFCLRDNK